MPVGRNPSGSQNSEAYPGPYTSPYGQTLFAMAGLFIAQPEPIGNFRKSVRGNIGGFSASSASVQALATQSEYYGDFPQSQQPDIGAPDPWERP